MKKLTKLFLSFMLIFSCFIVVNAENMHLKWLRGYDGKLYWYENNIKQGTYSDPGCVMGDGTCRGREIYDPASNGWYWLDSVYGGAKAESKEVWMPYVFQNEIPGSTKGKWVRYNENGKMIKGWYKNNNGEYYYDPITGAMLKGRYIIDGEEYYFNEITGILERKEVVIIPIINNDHNINEDNFSNDNNHIDRNNTGNNGVAGNVDKYYSPSNIYVWVPTNGGKKYHSYSTCSKMNNPEKVAKEYAIEILKFDACKRCH